MPFAGMLDLVHKDEDQALKVTSAGLRMFERKDQKVGHCFANVVEIRCQLISSLGCRP